MDIQLKRGLLDVCVLAAIKDEDTGIFFKVYCNTGTINLCKNLTEVEEDIIPALDYEYLGFLIHEQYYYPEYFAYQPDYADKILKMCYGIK